MMRRIILLLLSALPFLSFKGEEPCTGTLKECLKKMASVSKPQPGKACYMRLTIKKDMDGQSKVPDSDVEARITISEKAMAYDTDALSMYRDEEDAFTIIYSRRQVIWSKGSKPEYNSEAIKQMGGMQQEVIDQCAVQSCQQINFKGIKANKLTLAPPASYQKASKLTEMTFIYNAEERKIEQIDMKYAQGSALKEETVTFHEINFNYKGAVPKKVRNQVLTSSGQLLKQYKGYTLVDQR